MTIVACPRCRDEVTVPHHAGPDAIVRCPLCGEQYALRDALTDVPPMLMVIAPDESGTAAEVGAESADIPMAFAVAAAAPVEVAQAAVVTGDAPVASPVPTARPFVFEERPAPRRPTVTSSTSSRSRPARPERNAVAEIAKIVAGGVIGLSIGQLILWWMPGNWSMSQRDPLGIGQRLGRHIPFIVPATVRGTAGPRDDVSVADDSTAHARNSSRGPTSSRQDRSRPFSGNSGAGNGTGSSGRPSPLAGAGRSARSATEDSTGLPDQVADAPLTNLEFGEIATLPSNGRDVGSARGGTASGGLPQLGGQRTGVRDAPLVTAEALASSLAAAQLVWDQTTKDQKGAVAIPLTVLAHDVTFVDVSDPESLGTVEAVRSWLATIAPTSQTARDVALLTEWEDGGVQQPLSGKIVYGTVIQIQPRGTMFETRLATDDTHQTAVLSTIDPRSSFGVGDRVLVLGVQIHDPAKQLVGYNGLAKRAIFGGLVHKLPDDDSPSESASAAGTPEAATNDNRAPVRSSGSTSDATSNTPAPPRVEVEGERKPPAPPEPSDAQSGRSDSAELPSNAPPSP